MAEAGVVESIGNYAVMLICEDPTGARDAFLDCFDPETQQNTDYTFASVEHPKPLKNPQNNSNAADPTFTSTPVPGGNPEPAVQPEPEKSVIPSEPTAPVPGDGPVQHRRHPFQLSERRYIQPFREGPGNLR